MAGDGVHGAVGVAGHIVDGGGELPLGVEGVLGHGEVAGVGVGDDVAVGDGLRLAGGLAPDDQAVRLGVILAGLLRVGHRVHIGKAQVVGQGGVPVQKL